MFQSPLTGWSSTRSRAWSDIFHRTALSAANAAVRLLCASIANNTNAAAHARTLSRRAPRVGGWLRRLWLRAIIDDSIVDDLRPWRLGTIGERETPTMWAPQDIYPLCDCF